jgi:hypothetical protein
MASDANVDRSRAIPEPDGVGERASRPRIDYATRLLVVKLREAEPERSIRSIADVAGISEASARRLLSAHTTDVKAMARQLMQTGLTERIENWERACEVAAEKGYHQPSKDFLEAAGAIEPKPQTQVQVDARPTIALSMNFGLGALKDYQPQTQVLEAQPVPALPKPEET